ncbi:MAG: ABC transporter substrate-binding protein [Rhodospirillales bacterium]|nr:ABC transporter substrate-binding protein [Rhodospirillales bacterium]
MLHFVSESSIAQFVLGRHWKEASADQQSRYTEVFANFLIQSYATRLGGIRIDHFEVQEAHAIGKNDFLVRSKVDRGARKTVRADWRVRESDTGFKIIDLSVSGISLALTLREEFASILRREGLDGLIQLLKERTV